MRSRIKFLLAFILNSCLLYCDITLANMSNANIPQAADRIRDEPESVWVEFIQLALDHKPLNLGQGFPTFSLSLLFDLAMGVPGAVLLAEPNGFDIRFVSLNGFDSLF